MQFGLINDSLFRREKFRGPITIHNCKPLSVQIVRENGVNILSTMKTLAVQATRFWKPRRSKQSVATPGLDSSS